MLGRRYMHRHSPSFPITDMKQQSQMVPHGPVSPLSLIRLLNETGRKNIPHARRPRPKPGRDAETTFKPPKLSMCSAGGKIAETTRSLRHRRLMMTVGLVSCRLQARGERRYGRRSVCAEATRGVFVCHGLHFRQPQAVG